MPDSNWGEGPPNIMDIEATGIEKDSIAFYYVASWALDYVTMEEQWDAFQAFVESRRRKPLDESWQLREEMEQMAQVARGSAAHYWRQIMGRLQ